jgi:hypothetical protein
MKYFNLFTNLFFPSSQTEWPQIKVKLKRIITFYSGHILENELLHNSAPTFKFLFMGTRCGFYGWCGTRPIWLQARPAPYAVYLHRHSLPSHGFCLAVLGLREGQSFCSYSATVLKGTAHCCYIISSNESRKLWVKENEHSYTSWLSTFYWQLLVSLTIQFSIYF